ncbi:DegV family protein [Papillibacter cinnamivorans]|uniref:EDD domain protein, DegV family n=1 Tax=Papillibacter cinnamivorans DSM 12816 TaxID=1122930 RepID=A0A1W2CBC5_9FIRM|nr:DegV family protein [Papillibacter cinnamivorans]SMC82493.1 EDD domain protein, DegV family [Papillibacter cinnamivorans DSM 12816]
MTKIIVDSTCDLPKAILEQYDIKVMPLNVVLGDKEYLDGVEITVEELYAEMRRGVVPKTSQIRTEELLETFETYAVQAMDFIYLAFSSALSGTCDLAKMVLQKISAQYPQVKMEVVDSRSGSLATGLIALQAARMAENGWNYSVVLQQIDFMVEHIEHVFAISDLHWLAKGGRISRAAGLAGSLLDVRPILDVENGRMKVIGAARGRRRTMNALIELVKQRIRDFPEQIVGISHADDLPAAQEIMDMLREKAGITDFIVERIGSVLGAHLGIGGVGIFFFNAKPELYAG